MVHFVHCKCTTNPSQQQQKRRPLDSSYGERERAARAAGEWKHAFQGRAARRAKRSPFQSLRVHERVYNAYRRELSVIAELDRIGVRHCTLVYLRLWIQAKVLSVYIYVPTRPDVVVLDSSGCCDDSRMRLGATWFGKDDLPIVRGEWEFWKCAGWNKVGELECWEITKRLACSSGIVTNAEPTLHAHNLILYVILSYRRSLISPKIFHIALFENTRIVERADWDAMEICKSDSFFLGISLAFTLGFGEKCDENRIETRV